jgi:hypothetical protein
MIRTTCLTLLISCCVCYNTIALFAQGYVSPFKYDNGNFRMKNTYEKGLDAGRNYSTPANTPTGNSKSDDNKSSKPARRYTPVVPANVQTLYEVYRELINAGAETEPDAAEYQRKASRIRANFPYESERDSTTAIFVLSILQPPVTYDEYATYWKYFPLFTKYEFRKENIMRSISHIPFDKRVMGWKPFVYSLTKDDFANVVQPLYYADEDKYAAYVKATGDSSEQFIAGSIFAHNKLTDQEATKLLQHNYIVRYKEGMKLLPETWKTKEEQLIYEDRERNFAEIVRIRIKEIRAVQLQQKVLSEELDKLQKANEKSLKKSAENRSKEEEIFKKSAPPFGALEMFETAVTNKKFGNLSIFDPIALQYAKECFQKAGYEKGKSLKADILMASTMSEPQHIYQNLNTWSADQCLQNWYDLPIKGYDQLPKEGSAEYEAQYVELLSRAGQYDTLIRYIDKSSWTAIIKFAFPFIEALAITKKYDWALNFIRNFENRTYSLSVHNPYRGWSTLMTGILFFHKKEYKKAWEQFNDSKVNYTVLTESDKKWNAHPGIGLFSPRIFITKYAYYYFCCAKELRKKEYQEYRTLIVFPKNAPAFMRDKYRNLFTQFE